MTTGTTSVLFTDVVASTALLQRLGEDRARAFFRTHDDLMREAVESAGGQVVKGLGDGVMAVFTSSADALDGAVNAQRAADRHGRAVPDEAFALRAGISVGDIVAEAGDYFGTAVVEAARLCDVAQSGQILVSDLVRALARGRGGHVFESVGELVLKGLDAPVAACWVGWEPLAAAPGMIPFPPLLVPASTVGYAGRLGLLSALQKAWERVGSGQGAQTLLLVGEPGIGKTRTAAELARQAFDEGALVLYGRCDEELALPYEPFVEALDHQTLHAAALPLGRFPGDLVRLVPDLGLRIDSLPAAISSDPRAEEHRLFEAVASWISTASYDRGLVLVIDDLHWATHPTLQMLLHVVRTAVSDEASRVLFVGTYRDTDVDRTHPLSSTLADLRRLPGVERLPVDPLSEGEVIDLIETLAGHDLDENIVAIARRAHAETEGNPFFVTEVLRHFVESGAVRYVDGRWIVDNPDVIDVPEGVRDVIGRRLNRLSDTANVVLTAAATIGRDFTLDLVASVSGVGIDQALDALDSACAARLVEETADEQFRFSHALTRTTLYEELSATRRRRLHRRVVEALERLRPFDLSSLARHSMESGPVGGDLSGAIGYSIAAGEQALQGRAVADAAAFFEQALEMMEDATRSSAEQALQARCGLGVAKRDLGDAAHRQLLLNVTVDALRHNRLDLAARAAAANGRGFSSRIGGVDTERVEQLKAVLDRGHELDLALRATLTAALATELASDAAELALRQELADEACRLADQTGDLALIARVCVAASNPRTVPDRLDEMQAVADRAAALADQGVDPLVRVHLRGIGGWLRALNGDLLGARQHLEQARSLALAESTPAAQWFSRSFAAQLASWDGDVAATRAEGRSCLELGRALGEPDSAIWWGALELGLRHAEGTLGEMLPLLDDLVVQSPKGIGWRVFRALAVQQSGDHARVQALVDRDHLRDPDMARGDMFELACWGVQASVLWATRDLDALAAFGPRLRGHEHRWAATGAWPTSPLHLAAAQCAVGAGDLERAGTEATAAWRVVVEAGVRPLLPMMALLCHQVLREVGSVDALSAGRVLLERGLDEALALGMPVRIAELQQVLAG